MSFLFCLFICMSGLRFTLGHVTSVFSVLSFYLSVWVTVYIGTRQVCLFCSVFSFVCLGYSLHWDSSCLFCCCCCCCCCCLFVCLFVCLFCFVLFCFVLFCLFVCLSGFTLGHVKSVFSVLSFYLSVWVTVYTGTRHVCLFCSVFLFVCLGYGLHWDTSSLSFLFCRFICLSGLRFTLGHVMSVFSVLSFCLSVWVTVYIGSRQVCLICSVFLFVCHVCFFFRPVPLHVSPKLSSSL